jgi:uncharacterized membrane protein
MGIKLFIFVCNLIIPVIMLFFGVKFKKHSPKNINGFYGYRTSRSMKSKETWEFAHKYCGKLWTKLGSTLLVISMGFSIMGIILDDKVQGIINFTLIITQTIILIVSIFPVEKELKKNFDENGNRRD